MDIEKFINENKMAIGVILIIVVFVVMGMKSTVPPQPDWQEYYEQQAKVYGVTDPSYYQVTDMVKVDIRLKEVADEIRTTSKSPEEAAQKVIEFAGGSLKYVATTSVQEACFDLNASEALDKGYGDCSEFTKIASALYRELGIANKQVSGCVSLNPENKAECRPISYYPIKQSSADALYQKLSQIPKAEEKNKFGGYDTRGALHTWVEVWLPTEGWVIAEGTAGALVPKSCKVYYQFYTNDNYPNIIDDLAVDNPDELPYGSDSLLYCVAFPTDKQEATCSSI